MLKKLFRFAVLIAAAATIVWLTRENLLPRPRVTDDPRPHFRSSPPPPPPPPPPAQDPDDLTEIKGIGSVYAARLTDEGIQTFGNLADADPATVAESAGTSEDIADGWIAQARAKLA